MGQRDRNLQTELALRQRTGHRPALPLRIAINLIRHEHRTSVLNPPHGTMVRQPTLAKLESLRQHNLDSIRPVQLVLRGDPPAPQRPLLPPPLRSRPLLDQPLQFRNPPRQLFNLPT